MGAKACENIPLPDGTFCPISGLKVSSINMFFKQRIFLISNCHCIHSIDINCKLQFFNFGTFASEVSKNEQLQFTINVNNKKWLFYYQKIISSFNL